MMKKLILFFLTLALFTTLLCGCSFSLGVSSYLYDDAEQYTMGGASLTDPIENIEIDWIAGGITISSHTDGSVTFSEEANRELGEKDSLYYYLEGTTLHIQYCQSGKWNLGNLSKELTLSLPEELTLKDVEVSSVSADIKAEAIAANKVEIESVSGNIAITDPHIESEVQLASVSGKIKASFSDTISKLDVKTVSGNVDITADEIKTFDADTTSGNISLTVSKTLHELTVDSVSGDVALNLPADTNATVELDSVSGKLTCELPCSVVENKKYVIGNGSNDYDIDTTSGNVMIKEYEK